VREVPAKRKIQRQTRKLNQAVEVDRKKGKKKKVGYRRENKETTTTTRVNRGWGKTGDTSPVNQRDEGLKTRMAGGRPG